VFFLQAEYRKKAKESVEGFKDFTVLESRPDVQHAINTAKMQSNVRNLKHFG